MVVAMQFPRVVMVVKASLCSCCRGVTCSCWDVAMQLFRCCGGLSGCCYTVTIMLWVVVRVLLCSHQNVVGGC